MFYLLVDLARDHHNEDLEEVKWFAAIITSGIYDDVYLRGETFWWHCKQLRINPAFVVQLFNHYKETCK